LQARGGMLLRVCMSLRTRKTAYDTLQQGPFFLKKEKTHSTSIISPSAPPGVWFFRRMVRTAWLLLLLVLRVVLAVRRCPKQETMSSSSSAALFTSVLFSSGRTVPVYDNASPKPASHKIERKPRPP
jgi:hypothetical protein